MRTNRMSRLASLLVICLSVITSQLRATNYYVDPASSGSANGTLANPWKDIATVNAWMWSFSGGDTIFFRRGQHYTGMLNIYQAGTAVAPIVFMPYGTGASPVLEYALPDGLTPINRNIIAISNSYVVVDGFMLTDSTMSATDHTPTANIGRGIFIYNSNYVTLKNLDISRVGIAITVQGNNNLVENCNLHNLREIVNTAAPSNDDFGALGILINGSGNNILSNTISECWAPSNDYTYDGGAMELMGESSNNRIMYNTTVNNDGFMQINSDGSTATASDNLVAYNLLLNNGRVFWFNFNGTLTVQNFRFYNNDIVETAMQHSNYPYMIGCDIAPANANALVVTNNIFWVHTPIDLTHTATQPFNGAQMAHGKNLYHLNGGSLGYAISASDTLLAVNDTVFANTSNADPLLWDYHILAGSPALEYGQILGLTRDYAGTSVIIGSAPEAGMLETTMMLLSAPAFTLYGYRKGDDNMLQWQQEVTDAYLYTIEKSWDGKSFYPISTCAPLNGRPGYVYRFTDPGAAANRYYYRIRITLANQVTYTSKTILFNEQLTTRTPVLFPNPAASFVMVSLPGRDLINSTLSVHAADGRVMQQETVATHGAEVRVTLGNYPKGTYYLAVRLADGSRGPVFLLNKL